MRLLIFRFQDTNLGVPAIGPGLASQFESILPQYWTALVNPQVPEGQAPERIIQAVHVPCPIKGHSEAYELGRAQSADLVLWGNSEAAADAASGALSQLLRRGLAGASNASGNTIQAATGASVSLSAQQSFRIELPGDLHKVILKTSVTWIRRQQLTPGGLGTLKRSEGFDVRTIDFPSTNAERPLLALAHVVLGLHALRDDRAEVAAAEFQRAQEQLIGTGPGAPELDWLRGISLTLAGRLPGGASAFDTGLKRCAQAGPACQAGALHNQAWAAFRRGELQEARAGFQQALILRRLSIQGPSYFETLLQLAAVHEGMNDFKSAQEAYQSLIQLSSEARDATYLIDAYNGLGLLHAGAGDWSLALKQYDSALRLSEQTADRPGQIMVYNNKGRALEELDRPSEAAEVYQRALQVSEEARPETTPLGQALLFANQSRVARMLKRDPSAYYRQVDALYQTALQRRSQRSDMAGQVEVLCSIGSARAEAGDSDVALTSARRALALAEQTGDRYGQLRACRLAARAYTLNGSHQLALTELQRALELSVTLRNEAEQTQILLSQGMAHLALRNVDGALVSSQRALQISQKNNLPHATLRAYSALGAAYLEQSDHRESVLVFQRMLKLARELGHRRFEYEALAGITGIQRKSGQTQEALETLLQALRQAKDGDDPQGQVQVSMEAAELLWSFKGNSNEALALYRRALPLCQQLRDSRCETALHANLGALRCAMGQYEAGLLELEQAAGLGKASQLPSSFSRSVWLSVAFCHAAAGQITEAQAAIRTARTDAGMPQAAGIPGRDPRQETLEEAVRSRRMAQLIGSVPWEISALSELGAAYAQLARQQAAQSAYQEALKQSQAISDTVREAEARSQLGRLLASQGMHTQALDQLLHALELHRKNGDMLEQAAVLAELGALAPRAEARSYYESARNVAHLIGSDHLEATALLGLGRAGMAEGRLKEAVTHFRLALALLRKLDRKADVEAAESSLREAESKVHAQEFMQRLRAQKKESP